MRVKLASKALMAVFAINTMFIVLLVPLFYYFNDKFTNTIIRSNNDTSIILRDNIKKGYRDMAMDNMKMFSANTAYAVGQFLQGRKDLAKEDIMKSEVFQKMSVRPFYHTGYTIVADPDDFMIISHPESRFVGKHLSDIQNFSKATYETIVNAFIMSKSQSGFL